MSAPAIRHSTGDLRGPAPVPHQVREIVVKVEQRPDGYWRLTLPWVPGWMAAARNPVEVVAGIRRGFTEAQIAAHSEWRGCDYDASVLARRRRRAKRRLPSPNRSDVHDPRAWRISPDGRWISPAGNLYPEDSQAVRSVISKRLAMGLSYRPEPVHATAETENH